jgi:hypothetical protein
VGWADELAGDRIHGRNVEHRSQAHG